MHSALYRQSDVFASIEAQYALWKYSNHAGEHDRQVLFKLVEFTQREYSCHQSIKTNQIRRHFKMMYEIIVLNRFSDF